MDEYLAGAGIESDKASPLFRTASGITGKLTERGMHRTDARRMIQRRAREAGIDTDFGLPLVPGDSFTIGLRCGDIPSSARI